MRPPEPEGTYNLARPLVRRGHELDLLGLESSLTKAREPRVSGKRGKSSQEADDWLRPKRATVFPLLSSS